jgi:hypothetical protein
MTTRRFLRCSCCLSVIALDSGTASVCGACSGQLEPMGFVHRSIRPVSQCACDLRCTMALGPDCNCKCGGENHGQGLVVVAVGSSARPRDFPAALGRAGEWVASVGQFELEMAGMTQERRRRAARVLRLARESRVHRLRMGYLRDFLVGQVDESEPVLELDLG